MRLSYYIDNELRRNTVKEVCGSTRRIRSARLRLVDPQLLNNVMKKFMINVNVVFLIPEPDTFNRQDHRQIVFLKEEFHYLNVTKSGTYTVYDIFDCTFKCLSNPSCLSVNLASSKRADGKLWCELLSSTKYNNTREYRGKNSSHHFFIKVGQSPVRRVNMEILII